MSVGEIDGNAARISLKQFLRTGRLDDLKYGMSRSEVEQLLGPPDDTGGTSRKHRKPSIYLYGTLEIYFGGADRNQAVSFQIDCPWEEGPFRLPDKWTIDDWDLQPGMLHHEVQEYLAANAIAFRTAEPEPGLTARIAIEGTQVLLVLDDEGGLHSISAPLPE